MLAGAALPALGQDRPTSILPPGFGQPQSQSQPQPQSQPRPSLSPSADPGPATADAGPGAQPLRTDLPSPTDTPAATPTPAALDARTLAFYELPPFARRPLDRIGPVRSADGGLSADAFGRADGRYVEALMRRMAAPLPSRWLSILLRRTLLSEVETPRDVGGAAFAAERAWLLLRMGESVGARALVQGVDAADYTPKLYQVALNAMLATGDPAGLCPLADGGLAATGERGWVLAQAMCAALRGDGAAARALAKTARRRGVARGVDMLLAEKVVGAGGSGRQAVTIEWAGVDRLTPWRWGLAAATGVAIPDALLATTGRQVRLWQALSPGVAPPARVGAAEAAAGQGVLSNAALVDLYAALGGGDDDAPLDPTSEAAARDLGTAYADADPDARLAACKRLWGEATPYARLVLTARAAAGIAPSPERAKEADRLVASMLAAGLESAALRWGPTVAAGGDAWAMLALADPGGRALAYADLAGYAGAGDARLKQRLFFAGLAGLGRLSRDDAERAAAALDVRIGAADSWTRAIDRAAAEGQAGTVVLLAGIAMQTSTWAGVPPAMLYRIIASLRAVGLDGEARMIAAEAIARA